MKKKSWRAWAIIGGVGVIGLGTLTGLMLGSKAIRERILGATDTIIQRDYAEAETWAKVDELGLDNFVFLEFGEDQYDELNGKFSFPSLYGDSENKTGGGYNLYLTKAMVRSDSDLLKLPSEPISIKKGEKMQVKVYRDTVEKYEVRTLTWDLPDSDLYIRDNGPANDKLMWDYSYNATLPKHVYFSSYDCFSGGSTLKIQGFDASSLTRAALYSEIVSEAVDYAVDKSVDSVEAMDFMGDHSKKLEKIRLSLKYDNATGVDWECHLYEELYYSLKEMYLDETCFGFVGHMCLYAPNCNLFCDFTEADIESFGGEKAASVFGSSVLKNIYLKGEFAKVGNSYQPLIGKQGHDYKSSSSN